MDKRTKKRRTYNQDVVNALAEEFDVSKRFVVQCINKERSSRTAISIEKKYKLMITPTLQKIKEFKTGKL